MRLKYAWTAGAAATVIGAAMASAATADIGGGSVPLYDVVYYSDASYSTEVGRNYGVCYGGSGTPIWAGASEFTYGETTPYYINERVGRCTAHGTEYQ